MFKIIVIALVLQTVLHVCDAYAQNEHDETIEKTEYPNPKDNFKYDSRESYGRRPYKKMDEIESFEDKPQYKEPKPWEHKKYKGDGKDEFRMSKKYYDMKPKYEKYSKYDRKQNQYSNEGKGKHVNYHDKYNGDEKLKRERYGRQEIVNNDPPVSLLHDICVNYLTHHETLNSDAELINVENIQHNDKGKDYKPNLSEMNKKKTDLADFYKNLKEIDLTSIPSTNNSALVARYIIHNVDWTAIGTLSTNIKMKGGPFVNVISISDGPATKGSGVPFFYMTPKDFSSIDIEKDNRCSITATLAQTNFCRERNLDPESPLCARLILFGKVKKVKPSTDEENFAKLALFSRHPEMQTWPADHNWFFAKLKIKQIILIDHFGGAIYVNIQDYFNVDGA